jgi:hypothetical protein
MSQAKDTELLLSINTNTGAKADTAVTNSASSGSIIAFLKGILSKLGSVVLAAGTAVIGKVGIQVGGADVSNTVPVPIVEKTTSTAPAAAPVTVDTTAGGTAIAAANASRLSIILQNISTVACIIRLGGDPTTTALNLVLAPDSAARAGNGGSIIITGYTGAIKGITEAGSAVIAVTEVV